MKPTDSFNLTRLIKVSVNQLHLEEKNITAKYIEPIFELLLCDFS